MKRLIVFVLVFMTLFSDLYAYKLSDVKDYKNITKINSANDPMIDNAEMNLQFYCKINESFILFVDNQNYIHYIDSKNNLYWLKYVRLNSDDYKISECTQLLPFKIDNYYLYFVDLTFDSSLDYVFYESGSGTGCGLFFSDYQNINDFFSRDLLKDFGGIEIKFCILNGKRGFLFQDYDYNDKLVWSFYYWSPTEKRYILDETATQTQIKNAYCPEEYFAYNGLDFSKLDKALKKSDVKNMTPAQLRLMRNAIYARHGRKFTSVDLQSLWECYTWYKPNPDYNDNLLTKTDKKNLKLIQDMEKVTGTYVPDLPR